MATKTNGIENRIGDYSIYSAVSIVGKDLIYVDVYENETREKKVGNATFNITRLKELYNIGIGKIREFTELERLINESENVIKQNKVKREVL